MDIIIYIIIEDKDKSILKWKSEEIESIFKKSKMNRS